MGKNTSTKATTPQVPSYVAGPLADYYAAVGKKAETISPDQFTQNPSSLQSQAFAMASKLGGSKPATGGPTNTSISSAYNTAAAAAPAGGSGSAPAGSTPGSTPMPTPMGGGLYAAYGVTPTRLSGNLGPDGLPLDASTVKDSTQKNGSMLNPDLSDPNMIGAFFAGPAAIQSVGSNQKATNAYDVFGKPSDNAQNAGAADWMAYWNANPDVQAWGTNLKTSDPRGYALLAKSFDFNGDGEMSPGELAQAHYYAIGGQKEGRQIITPADAAAAATGASGGAPATANFSGDTQTPLQQTYSGAPANDTSTPGIDSNALFTEALDKIRSASNTTLKPRLLSDFYSQQDKYLQPFNDQITAYDAQADERLATQKAANQARATITGAFNNSSRLGVQNAELDRTSLLDKNTNDANLRAAALDKARADYSADSDRIYTADVGNLQNTYTGAQDLTALGTTADSNTRSNIASMLQAGSVQQAIQLANQTRDLTALQEIAKLLGVNVNSLIGSNSTETAGSTSPAGSALGGAATGASVGSSFGPWGTLIGGAAGAIGGYYTGKAANG